MKDAISSTGAAGALALAALTASPALAAGTLAGTSITNTVTVDYQIGGIALAATDASDSFTVDRKITMTVAEVGTTTTPVLPGFSAAVTAFTVTNHSNATLDFTLVAVQQSGGAGAHANTDSFDATNVKVYIDTNGNGSYDAGIDTEVSYIDELAGDASQTVFVVVDIPAGLNIGEVAAVTLTATAREGGTVGIQGAALSQTSGVNTSGMDTIFADTAGATDGSGDAAHSAKDDYTVLAAALTVTKLSTVVSDPVNGISDPKAIPGATIEYCVIVANGASGAAASSVEITDPLPGQVTYDASYGIFVGGTVTSGACNADGSAGGSYSAGTVSGTLPSVAAGETKSLRFRATIN